MFRKDMPTTDFSPQPQKRLETVIGDGTKISGEIRVDGDLRVDGEIEGQISATSRVVVGKTGLVKADVEAGAAEIAGRVVGKISARERVVLLGGARLEGDVQSQSFKIEDGAYFQGNCVMGDRHKIEALDSERPRIQLANTSKG